MSLSKHRFKGCSGTGTVPRPYTLPASGLSTLFLGLWPVSWHCLGSHKQCCWPVSRRHKVCEQLGQWLKLALPQILNDALWWHSLSRPITSLYNFRACGGTEIFVFESLHQFCYLLYGAAIPTILWSKAKVCIEEDGWTKQRLGLEHETSLSTRKTFCLTLTVCWACRHLGNML